MSPKQSRKPYIVLAKLLDSSVNISRCILCYRCPLSTVPEFLGTSLSYTHMSFNNLCLTEILRNCSQISSSGQDDVPQAWPGWKATAMGRLEGRDQHTALLSPARLPGAGTQHSPSSFKLFPSHLEIFGQMEDSPAPEDTSRQNKSSSMNNVLHCLCLLAVYMQ